MDRGQWNGELEAGALTREQATQKQVALDFDKIGITLAK
jgi:hypothetical protein